MKTLFVLLLSTLFAFSSSAPTLKPYTIGLESEESIAVLRTKVEAQLKLNNIRIVGRTKPARDNNRWVIAITSSDLDKAVQQVGGLTGFSSVLRIALTKEGSKTIVSYTNPAYWGNAYFQKKFPQVANHFTAFDNKLKKSFKALGTYSGEGFGSKKGISASKLRSYQYMMGMPDFDDTEELKKFNSHTEALAHIDANVKKGIPNVKLVYKHKVAGKNLVLYGFALTGTKGEGHFLPTIDIGTPKHTAFLPYEILVKDGEVHMLHGRFRIALSFPDLTMSTFMKIMSTPGDIEELLTQVVE